ncbi:short-chain dehydrogenase/reductase SDR [Caballeronia turbans]|nr:short-chain dehydrogenase/reductase SDR [Caballeronia turbans]
MRRQGFGGIVNLSSIGGQVGFPTSAIYAASKHAVEGLTKSAALEVAFLGIRVNAVAPAPTESPMFDRLADYGMTKDVLAGITPVKRAGNLAFMPGEIRRQRSASIAWYRCALNGVPLSPSGISKAQVSVVLTRTASGAETATRICENAYDARARSRRRGFLQLKTHRGARQFAGVDVHAERTLSSPAMRAFLDAPLMLQMSPILNGSSKFPPLLMRLMYSRYRDCAVFCAATNFPGIGACSSFGRISFISF